MKLYVFQPEEHGPVRFSVLAEHESAARSAIDRYVDALDSDAENCETCAKNQREDWRAGGYYVREYGPGEVAVNDND